MNTAAPCKHAQTFVWQWGCHGLSHNMRSDGDSTPDLVCLGPETQFMDITALLSTQGCAESPNAACNSITYCESLHPRALVGCWADHGVCPGHACVTLCSKEKRMLVSPKNVPLALPPCSVQRVPKGGVCHCELLGSL